MTKGDEPEVKTCPCGEPHDGWPGENGEELCQMCWESECDKSWWRMVNALNALYVASESKGSQELNTYEWRCNCGKENQPTTVYCLHCDQRRWSNLGFTHMEVLGLLSRILPLRLFLKVEA